MAAADGGATPPAAPADSAAAPRAPEPAPEASAASATTAPPALQIDPQKIITPEEKLHSLICSWQLISNMVVDSVILNNLYNKTLQFLLQNKWSHIEEVLRNDLIQSIQKCSDTFQDMKLSVVRRIHYLVLVVKDPWHHPVLKEIMNGVQPELQKVRSWVEEEGDNGAAERLKQLCAAGGKLEAPALRLAQALTPTPPVPQVLRPHLHSFAIEALLVLLMRARKTSECISQIKALEIHDAIDIVRRLAKRNKSHGRIWKNAHDTALLCGQVLVATCLVKVSEDNQVYSLAFLLASLYSNCPDELAPTIRKLLQSADSASHIYAVCRAVQNQYVNTMQPFICELYIRALTTGVNELERSKLQDEASTITAATSHKLAAWFLSLADLLSSNPTVSAECTLTAFSLHPSKYYYERVEKCSLNLKNLKPIKSSCDYNISILQNNSYHSDSTDCKEDMLKMNILKSDEVHQLGDIKPEVATDLTKDDMSAQSLVSSAVLECEGLELSTDLCRDLVVLLSGPRLKFLTWDLNWNKLSQHCLSYMADTAEGTKTVTTELKYVHLDYSQFEIKEPEIHDVYFGIEKGYEHHLEIEESDDEYINEATVDNSGYNSPSLYFNNNKDVKLSKKKSSKKRSDDKNQILITKVKDIKQDKERKPVRTKTNKKKVNSKINSVDCSTSALYDDIHHMMNGNQNFDNTTTSNISVYNAPTAPREINSNRKLLDLEKKNAINNQFSHTSFYRKQMEHHEASRREIEKLLFGESKSILKNEVKNQYDTNIVSKTDSKLSNTVASNLTYHEGHKENLKSHCGFDKQEMIKCSQNNVYIPNKSNSIDSDFHRSNNKSNLLLFRKQNVKDHTTLYDHTQSCTTTDWEKLIANNMCRSSPTINDSSNNLQYVANHKFSQDFIRSLNMQSTKLPAKVNNGLDYSRVPELPPRLTNLNNEILVKLLKDPVKHICYPVSHASLKSENSIHQPKTSTSNSLKSAFTCDYLNLSPQKHCKSNVSELNFASKSYNIDSHKSDDVTTNSQAVPKLSTNKNPDSEDFSDLNKCPKFGSRIKSSEILSTTISPDVISSIIVHSKDTTISSDVYDYNESAIQDVNIPIIKQYKQQKDGNEQANYDNFKSSSSHVYKNQFQNLTSHSIDMTSKTHDSAEIKNFYSSSNRPSIQYQKKLLQSSSIQTNDKLCENLAINYKNEDSYGILSTNKTENSHNSIKIPAIKSVSEIQKSIKSLVNSENSTTVKNVPSLLRPPTISELNLDCGKIQNIKFTTNAIGIPNFTKFPTKIVSSSSCPIICSELNLHNDNSQKTPSSQVKFIKSKPHIISKNMIEKRSLLKQNFRDGKIFPIAINTINEPLSTSGDKNVRSDTNAYNNLNISKLGQIKDTTKSSAIKKDTFCVNSHVKKFPSKNVINVDYLKKLKNPIQPHMQMKHSPIDSINNNVKMVEKSPLVKTAEIENLEIDNISEQDAFLKELFNAVNAGSENPMEKSDSGNQLQNAENDSIYKEFLAELHSSVNAGISLNLDNKPNLLHVQNSNQNKNLAICYQEEPLLIHSEIKVKDKSEVSTVLSSKQNEHIKDVLHSTDHKCSKIISNSKNIKQHISNKTIAIIKSKDVLHCEENVSIKGSSSKSILMSNIEPSQFENSIFSPGNSTLNMKIEHSNKEFSDSGTSQSQLGNSNQLTCLKSNKTYNNEDIKDNSSIHSSAINSSKTSKVSNSNIDELISKITKRADLVIKVGKNSINTPCVALPNPKDYNFDIEESKELPNQPLKSVIIPNINKINSISTQTNAKTEISSKNVSDLIVDQHQSEIVQDLVLSENPVELQSKQCFLQNSHPKNKISTSDEIYNEFLRTVSTTLTEELFNLSPSNSLPYTKSKNVEKFSPKSMTNSPIPENVSALEHVKNSDVKLEETKNLIISSNSVENIMPRPSIDIESNVSINDQNAVDISVLSFKVSGSLNDQVLQELEFIPKNKDAGEQFDISDNELIDFENAIAMNVITPKLRILGESFTENETSKNKDKKNIDVTTNKEKNKQLEESKQIKMLLDVDKSENTLIVSGNHLSHNLKSTLDKNDINESVTSVCESSDIIGIKDLKNPEKCQNIKDDLTVNKTKSTFCNNPEIQIFTNNCIKTVEKPLEVFQNKVTNDISLNLSHTNDKTAAEFGSDNEERKSGNHHTLENDIKLEVNEIIDITLDDSDDYLDKSSKNEIIEILSDDDCKGDSNSDVEFVFSSDPIAVDTQLVSNEYNKNSNASLSVVPIFFTDVPNILRKNRAKRKQVHNIKQDQKSTVSKSMYLVDEGTSEIIKTKSMPAADLQKLKLHCEVRIDKMDLVKMQKCLTKLNVCSKRRFKRKIYHKTNIKNNGIFIAKNGNILKYSRKILKKKFSCTAINTRSSSKTRCNKTEDNGNQNNPDTGNNILNCKIKEEVDDISIQNLSDVELNLLKKENENPNLQQNINKDTVSASDAQLSTEKPNGKQNNCPPDVLDSHSITNCENKIDVTKSNNHIESIPINSLSNAVCHPDILHESNPKFLHTRVTRSSHQNLNNINLSHTEFSKKIVKKKVPVNIIQCSNICPDLLNKNGNSNTFVTMQQPDIVLSNDKKHIDVFSASPKIKTNVFNGSSDLEKIDFSNNSFKTYQKISYHKNKRKSESDTSNAMKKLCTDLKIDLPEVSQEDINLITHVDFSLGVEKLLMEEYDSNEIFQNDRPIKENVGVDKSGQDLEYKFDFLSKNSNFNTDECSRNSFYSPIFNECETDSAIESYINKCENQKVFENSEKKSNKHLWQGKGFGVRSDRGNLKDSIRGRPEGPAAVLSDTITTRLPLALHNFSVKNNKECIASYSDETVQKGNDKGLNFLLAAPEKEMNNNSLCKIVKTSKSIVKQFFDRKNENNQLDELFRTEDVLHSTKFQKAFSMKIRNPNSPCKYDKLHKFNDFNIFSRIPGLEDLDFMRPCPSTAIVQVVQLGQSPVTSAQQNQLTTLPSVSQTNTSEYGDVTTNNSAEYQSLSNEDSHQSSSNENNVSDSKENDNSDENQDVGENNKKSDENTSLSMSCEISDNEANQIQISQSAEPVNSSSDIGNLDQITIDKQNSLNFSDQVSNPTSYNENIQVEEKDNTATEPLIETQMNSASSSSTNFIPANRGQTLVNLLSQKIIHSPVAGQHVQMTTFPKGTINALSLQQALAQILPPPLSQASGESVIQSANHSTGPQVVHIVQGKSGSQNNNSFGSLLVDNAQSSVMNNPGSTQVLHIVQGKPTPNTSNSSILSQSQIAGTTFSGLSLVDSNTQQSGNQVLHIVNAGMQSKNNTAQVLKRVNLLTSITNPQGNNEQKMVQFVCKASDGKPIQLNAQHQRGMVLRLQPIDNSNFNTPKSENQSVTSNISSIQSGVKPQNDQAQELKSRSMYEENYAKFIQNSSQIPSSPEKSTALPKFNQAFGKSVFQDNAVPKSSDNMDQSQNIAVTVSNEQSSQDLSNTLNLSQLGHINNPPLLIRKNPPSNIVHQNVVQQVKQSIAPMNIQTIHGGVIYTRQIPVNTINLITVPSADMIDEVQLQSLQKQTQDKTNTGESHLDSQVVKIVSQDQQQPSNALCQMESTSEDSNATFTEQTQNNVNTHPLLTQMRIKVPMLSKTNNPMVTGTRVVRPVLQIQRNLIPGTNPAVYQQLVLTAAPTLRQPVPNTPTANIRPSRPPATTPQESNMSTSTLEQLREFDMVLEQVKERSTVQPGSSSNSTFSDTSPQRHVIDNNTELDSSQSSVVHSPAQREVLYSIGPNQTVNVTYVNQKVISKTPTVLTTTYTSSDSNISTISSQNSPSNQITHGLVNTISHSKPCTNTPTKVNSKSIKAKPNKPTNPSSSSASKPSPVAAKTSLQKPLEDEQTTQRILYILAEYKEQVENSPDKDKPAPRRRSNPPTNPTTSSKRKKGSSGSSKKSSSGQSLQEMSPLGGEDAGHTMGSEDSSCGLSQGECTDNSIQGTENQSPQASPQKAAKKLLFQPESDMSQSAPQLQPQQQTQPQQQRNVIIADGQTIAMTRPGAGKTTAVLMPANYLLPMSMVKGGQQITIVTNQGPKILSVPQGEGNATNTLFLQRLISPTGLKPMLTRPGQVRHVRLPANTVQNLQAFNLSPTTNVNSQDSTWIANNSLNSGQPKLVVEYNPNITNNSDLNPDSVKSEISDSPSLKDENASLNSEHVSCVKLEDSTETSDNRLEESLSIEQSQTSIQESSIQNLSDHVLQQVHVSKPSGNTLNLIQVHSLNSPECGKLFTVQNSSSLNSLIQIPNKSALNQSLHNLNAENDSISSIVQESSQSMMRKQTLENQFLNTNKSEDGDPEMKIPDINQLDENLSISDDLSGSVQQGFVLSHPTQSSDSLNKCHGNRETHTPWSTNGSVNRDASPNFGYESSPHRLSNPDEHHDGELPETEEVQGLGENVATRVLRHSYSPSSPTGPRHLYHKMFISTPAKKSFGSEMVDRSVSSVDEDKQYVQVLDIRHSERKTCSSESVDVTTVQGTRNSITSSSASAHNAASLRHKYAVMEHELRLQKSLSEECEDLGVDSPSASDLFPEAELLFAASPSSQFDQSQDGCILPTNNQSSPSVTHMNPTTLNHQIASSSSISNLTRESRIISDQPMDVAEESEFARMHPNTTFHSGEIELVSDDADDSSVNISFRRSSNKQSIPQSQVSSKRGDIVRSVIEGIGSSGGITTFSQSKMSSQFSMVDLSRRSRNTLSSLQSSDDYSEGADDSMNSAESKEGIINNKSLDGILSNEIVKRDINLSSTESSVCMPSNIIQRNVTQVIRHSSSDQLSLPGNDSSDKLCNANMSELAPNGRNFLLESSSDARNTTDAGILKSIMMERDGRDALTCSSPEQHSELFWESNSNSNQSEEHLPQAPASLLDFSSEDSNKCCKSPLSCEETNSTDSSSLGGHNHQSHNSHHPLRLNSVIKTSVGNSSAADGPILHNALISSTPNVMTQDISKKLPMTLNSMHKSDSNTSSSPEEDGNRTNSLRTWGRSIKTSGGRKVISPRSLSAEINMGAEIETSSSEGVSILTKSTSGTLMHSGSSTPEEGSGNNRRVSLRGSGGIKRSCHCCGGAPATSAATNNSSSSRRARRRPPPLH